MNVTIPQKLAARIVWFCSRRNVQAGETIIDKNSTGRDIYVISRGQFRVHDDSAGEDFVLAMLERGDIFGEMSFLDGSMRSASVTATSSGSLLVMGETEFSAMLAKEPEVAVMFLKFLAGVVCGRLMLTPVNVYSQTGVKFTLFRRSNIYKISLCFSVNLLNNQSSFSSAIH